MADLVYEVSFKGVASPMLHAAFPGCDLETGAGLTVVRCRQDALRGVIERIEELALQLLHIRLVAEHSPEPEPAGARTPRSSASSSGTGW